MLLDVVEFKILDNYEILIKFENEELKKISLEPLLNEKPFSKLKDIIFFRRAFLEPGTLCWPDEIDIAPEYLYNHSVDVS
jgi:hypothetical protein